jgi:hypothetical protein
MPQSHLAQVNIARMKAPLESPELADFVARLEHLEAHGPSPFAFTFRSIQEPETSGKSIVQPNTI